jgi:hypothetical protein
MAQLIGVLLAIGAYIALCIFLCTYVLVPAWPFAVVGGAVLGLAVVVVTLAGVLLSAGGYAARTVTPDDVAERLPGIRSPFPRDDAWPNYLFAQSWTDLAKALRRTSDAVTAMWMALVKVVADETWVLALWPLVALPALGALTLTASVIGSGLLIYGVVVAVLAAAWIGCGLMVAVLRTMDAGVRRIRRAKATCHHPGCNYRGPLPAYRCPCARVHHDIRAGRQGALLRRCACGRVLPTTVLKAAASLVAVCQSCGRELRTGAAVLTDVVVPVFGPASAGKTRLVLAGMVALSRHLAAVGGTMTPVGRESETSFGEATELVDSKDQTTKTDANKQPVAITVRFAFGKRKAQLHLFDAAGEFFRDRERTSELRFLDDVQGLVFVLDPFSIPAVADELRGPLAGQLTEAQPALQAPEESYLVTAQMLGDHGIELGKLPLAVAVVKADLLLGLPPAAGLDATSGSADVEAWLRDQQLDNMVDGARRDFDEVRFFLVDSMDLGAGTDGRAGGGSPARPLLWLLQRSGARIPDPTPEVAL